MAEIGYAEALEDVMARVNKSRTSFRAGMAILPKERREAMYALYAFCREVDDIADDGPTLEIRQAELQKWRERLSQLFRGIATNTITAALAPAVKKFDLIEKDFQDIIDGMAMDAAAPIMAPEMKTLDLYCDRVASAVGRVSVRIFGDASAAAMNVSLHLGRSFQLTNILRDLAEDAQRGRLYLPLELLTKNGVTVNSPAHVLKDPQLPAVCRELAAVARGHFLAAELAMRDCSRTAMRPARIMRAYYHAIFERLVAGDWKNPATRVHLPMWQKLWLALRCLVG